MPAGGTPAGEHRQHGGRLPLFASRDIESTIGHDLAMACLQMQQFFNPFPKHLQIREVLLRRLRAELQVGDRFPSEKTLCAEFQVSRETVREALAWLAHEGFLTRHRGRGSFVSRLPEPGPRGRLTGLSEDLTELDPQLRIRVLDAGPVSCPPDVAHTIGVPAGEAVFRITRLRTHGGEPLSHHESFLPLRVGEAVAARDLTRGSMLQVLEHGLRIPFWEDHQQLEAMVADCDMAALLDVPIGAPLLHLVRVWLTEGHLPLVLFRSHYRSDRYYYTVRIDQRRERTPARHRAPPSRA